MDFRFSHLDVRSGATRTRSPRNEFRSDRRNHKSKKHGFTLAEILVVVSILVIVLALAVPVFNVLSGSRSIETAQNVLGAALGQARTNAINDGRYSGVLFYVDPADRRTRIALVSTNILADRDPLRQYGGWVSGVTYKGTASSPPSGADLAITRPMSLQELDASVPLFIRGVNGDKPVTFLWQASRDHSSNPSNNPPTQGEQFNRLTLLGVPPQWTPFTNAQAARPGDAAPRLPSGVGAQVILSQRPNFGSFTLQPGETSYQRYAAVGLIAFDPQGRLTLREFEISPTSELGKVLRLDQQANQPTIRIQSGLGVVLFDEKAFFDNTDHTLNDASPFVRIEAYGDDPRPGDEAAEEAWIDQNSTPLLVNRSTGTVVRPE